MSDEAVDMESNQNSEQEPELEQNQDTGTEAEVPDDVEALKALVAQKDHEVKKLYARFKREQETKAEAKKPDNLQPEGDLEWRRKIEFITTKGRNLDADSIDEVIAYAKGKGISYEKALESPVMKSYLSDLSSKERVARATPPPSAGSKTFNGKRFHDLEQKDKEANFHNYVKAIVEAKR